MSKYVNPLRFRSGSRGHLKEIKNHSDNEIPKLQPTAFEKWSGGPERLDWLQYETVSKRWGEWEEEFTKHYELDDDQKARLASLLDGPDEIVGKARFPDFPDGLKIGGKFAREKIIRAERDQRDKNKRYKLIVDGKKHLLPSEQSALLREGSKFEKKARATADAIRKTAVDAAVAAAKKANKDEKKAAKLAAETAEASREYRLADRQANLAAAFNRAIKDVFKRSSNLSFREKLAAMLIGDSKRVSIIRKEHAEGTVDHKRPSKTSEYIDRLKRYEAMLADAQQDFQQEHLNAEYARIRTLKAELVGPVKQLEVDLKTKARGLLNDEQLAKGLPPGPDVFANFSPDNIQVAQADVITMWALMVLGGMMIVGLFSRLTALFGALLVLSFYLVMPPWPGVPPAPGPEHSLIVNKNLIEVAALFTLAFIPTGKWFGLDSFFVWLFPGRYAGPSPSRGGKKKSSSKSKSKSGKSNALSPAERVVKAGDESKEAAKPEPVKAAESKDTYPIQPKEKSK